MSCLLNKNIDCIFSDNIVLHLSTKKRHKYGQLRTLVARFAPVFLAICIFYYNDYKIGNERESNSKIHIISNCIVRLCIKEHNVDMDSSYFCTDFKWSLENNQTWTNIA